MPGAKAQGRLRAYGMLLFAAVVLFSMWRTWRMRYMYIYEDEGDAMLIGWLITRGHDIYGDLFSNHMPLTYFLTALMEIMTPGEDHAYVRMGPWLCWVLAGLSLALSPALKGQSGGARPWIAASLFLATISMLGHHWWLHMVLPDGIWGALMAIFFALYFLPALTPVAAPARVAFVGGLAGALALFTSHLALITICGAMVFVALHAWRRPVAGALVSFKACLGGIAAGTLAMLLAVVQWGTLADFWEQAMVFIFTDYVGFAFADGAENPGVIMGFLTGLWKQIGFLQTVRPFFFIGMALSVVALVDQRRSAWAWVIALGPALVVSFGTVMRVGIRDMFVHDGPFFVLGAFLGAFAVARIQVKSKPWFWKLAAVAMLVGIVELSNHGGKSWYQSSDPMAWAPRLKPFVEHVRKNSHPDDLIAAGNYVPVFYLLTNREPSVVTSGTTPWLENWLKQSKWKKDSCEQAEAGRSQFVLIGQGQPWPSCFYSWLPKSYTLVMKDKELELWQRGKGEL